MTAQFQTLDYVLEQIRHRGNLTGYEQRHGADRIKEIWNASNQELRELVSQHGSHAYLKRTAPVALPTAPAVDGEGFATLDWPLEALSIHSVRVLRSQFWRQLKEISPEALHDYQARGGSSRLSGLPMVYALGRLPYGVANTETAGEIFVAPVPTQGTFSIWYTEAWTPITDGGAIVNSVGAFLEWTINDTIIKCSGKDAKASHSYSVAVTGRDRAEARIVSRARRLSENSEIVPRNARADGSRGDNLFFEDD